MEPPSLELKLRVILVTTRAALRHADSGPTQRAIVERGRSLLETMRHDEPVANRPAIDQALGELDRLVDA